MLENLIPLLLLFAVNEKVNFNFVYDPIDVVIPAIEKDIHVLDHVIRGIRENGKNIRRVIVVSPEKLTDQAEWFDEALFPFNSKILSNSIEKGSLDLTGAQDLPTHPRTGWYLQQLIKLYASFVIPDLSSNVLIIDADTVFLRPIEFLNEKNGGLYSHGYSYHKPYFEHVKNLLPGLGKIFPPISGVCHHMLFQRPVLNLLFEAVENHHQLPFWQAFCLSVHPSQLGLSGASEYEIYFNFAFSKTDQITLRPLKWLNLSWHDIHRVQEIKDDGYDQASFHNR